MSSSATIITTITSVTTGTAIATRASRGEGGVDGTELDVGEDDGRVGDGVLNVGGSTRRGGTAAALGTGSSGSGRIS